MKYSHRLKKFVGKVGDSTRLQTLVFITGFALIGVIYLVVSFALAPPASSDIQVLLPKNGANVSGRVILDANVKNYSFSPNTTGKVKIDGQTLPGIVYPTVYGWVYRSPGGEWNFNFANYSVGPHTLAFTFQGVDSAPIIVNNTAQVQISQPTANGVLGQNVMVAANVVSTKPFNSVKLRVDGVEQPGAFVSNNSYGWIYRNPAGQYGVTISQGQHSLEVDADSIISESRQISILPPQVSNVLQVNLPTDNQQLTNPFKIVARIDNIYAPTQLLIDGQPQPGGFEPTIYGWLYVAPDGTFNVNKPTGAHTIQIVNANNKSNIVHITVGNSIVSYGGGGLNNGNRLGIATGSPYLTNSGAYNENQYFDKIKSLGLQWARTDIHPCRYSDLGVGDALINQARRSGLKLILTIDYAFCGLGENSWNSAPKDRTAWAIYAGNLAEHWNQMAPGVVGAIEIWNEPNNSHFWNPVDPGKYTDLLRQSYSQIKSKVPNMLVLAGGPAPAGGNSSDANPDPANPATFYKLIYNGNGGSSNGLFDAAATHPYNSQNATSINANSNNGYRNTFWIRKTMNAHGDQAKQIWGTEAGWPTCYLTFGHALNDAQQDFRLKGDLKDWFYGIHDGNGNTVGYSTTSDWNTGPFMIFRLYKNTNGPDPGFGLIFDNNSCDGGQANHSGAYEPPAITSLKQIAALAQTSIP